ncbi:MAG TPA: FAD-binding oxidoreductase [Steroidobacteraceae bacterium]
MPKIGHDSITVVGAGVIGCAVAQALAAEGKPVVLLDRAAPASAGASFGNVGHIATEQVETLPSKQLLLGFWRELFAFGGALDIPLRRVMSLSPWLVRFAIAAFRQKANTRHLAPLVRGAADALEQMLAAIGRRDLIRRGGHYAVWLGPGATSRAAAAAVNAARLGVHVTPAPGDLLRSLSAASKPLTAVRIAALHYPDTAHVLDPAEVARAFATAAVARGALIKQAEVKRLQRLGDGIEVITESERFVARTVVVCAGAWSASLLAPFGLHAPLEAERGYHVELPDHPPLADAPVVYADEKIVVTPMAGRLRASSYLELAGLNAPPDPRKPARLRARLSRLGYRCDPDGPSWMGPRPTLPDYLPGIGRAVSAPNLFYAVGHQHLGLTLAAPTAQLIAALIAGRNTSWNIDALDLRRFGRTRSLAGMRLAG